MPTDRDKLYELPIAGNEKGMVLVVAILLIATLIVLGSTAVMTTTSDIKISSNYKAAIQALYDAESGVHYAIGLIRSDPPWKLDPDNPPDPVPTPSGFNFSGISIVSLGGSQYRITSQGSGANNAQRSVEVVFTVGTLIPGTPDGAMAMYGSGPTVQLKTGGGGGYNVDGHDYPLPASFTCTGSSCKTTAPATGGTKGLYTTTSPTVTGDTSHVGGDPPQAVGGGTLTEQNWIDFVDYIVDNNLYVENVMGTRLAPLITRVTSGVTLGGNMEGAGILIVDDGGAFDVGGTGHFEGLVILRGTGTFVGHGTGNIIGSVITIDHASKTVDLNGTVDILYSSQALTNLSNMGSMKTVIMTSWKDNSL